MENKILREILQKLLMETDSQPIPLSVVISDYMKAKTDTLSVHTVRGYRLAITRLKDFLPGDPDFGAITPQQVREFLATVPGSRKNKKNHHIALGALWTYAINENYCSDHVVRRVEVAKPIERAIIPFSRNEVAQLLAASTEGRNQLRNVALIKTLLDTGLRASEICGLKLCDLEGDFLRVLGKGSKERQVPVSPPAQSAIVAYIQTRHAARRTAPVFMSATGVTLNRDSLRLMINRLAVRADVTNAHPHKFRHTFAINYLLNGGDPYTLQAILGHTTLDMVKKYLYLTKGNLSTVHARVSPLIKWNL